jgi:hypothetical protein
MTRCSAIGLLPRRASPVTVRSEARGTTWPRSSDRPWTREPTRRLPASRRSGTSSPGQVNSGEVLIKAVIKDKPKMLTGLDQNGMWSGTRGSEFPRRGCRTTGRQARPYPGTIEKVNEVTPLSSPRGKADRKER